MTTELQVFLLVLGCADCHGWFAVVVNLEKPLKAAHHGVEFAGTHTACVLCTGGSHTAAQP